MATSSQNSPEYLAIKKHFLDLKGTVLRGDIPAALFQNDLITRDVFSLAINHDLGRERRGNDIMINVLDTVATKRELFESFCDSLTKEDITEEIVSNLRSEYVLNFMSGI